MNVRSSSALLAPFVVVVVVASVGSGCLPLDRAAALAPGSVQGRAVDETRATLPRAVIGLAGGPRRVFADNDGAFTLAGLGVGGYAVTLSHDADGDGVADLGAFTSFLMPAFGGKPVGIDLGSPARFGSFARCSRRPAPSVDSLVRPPPSAASTASAPVCCSP